MKQPHPADGPAEHPRLARAIVAAAHADPTGTALTDVARSALASGLTRDHILQACEAARLELRPSTTPDDGEIPVEDRVLDLMDRLTGWCAPSARI